VEFAAAWLAKGFDAFKFSSAVADDGVALEMQALRERLGTTPRIACDMHWAHTSAEAVALIQQMAPFGLWFAEAPVRTEDINGLAAVAAAVGTAIAVGEEWRTVHDMKLRTDRCRIGIVQPEMGHTGITEFMRIGQLAHAHHLDIMPHATIGAGIFLAASLHASAALPNIACHEFQHSIFEPNRRLVKGAMDCREGAYYLPEAHGLGVVPSDEAIALMKHYE
jgi:galactonate dehydratase